MASKAAIGRLNEEVTPARMSKNEMGVPVDGVNNFILDAGIWPQTDKKYTIHNAAGCSYSGIRHRENRFHLKKMEQRPSNLKV